MMNFKEYRCSNCGGAVNPSNSNCPHCGVRINGGDLSLDDFSLWKFLYSLFLSIMIIGYFDLSYHWIIIMFLLLCGIFILAIPLLWDEIR